MKSAGNEGVVQSRLQVLHVHVFLVAPLGARHMAQPRTDQHQGGISVRECPHHAGPAADLPVQPLDHIVGTDTRPMLSGKIAGGQRFFHSLLRMTSLHPVRASRQTRVAERNRSYYNSTAIRRFSANKQK